MNVAPLRLVIHCEALGVTSPRNPDAYRASLGAGSIRFRDRTARGGWTSARRLCLPCYGLVVRRRLRRGLGVRLLVRLLLGQVSLGLLHGRLHRSEHRLVVPHGRASLLVVRA